MSEIRTRYTTRAGFDPPDPIDDTEPEDWPAHRERAGVSRRSVADKEPKRCQALRSNGQPCTAPATHTGFCIGHRPESPADRAKGGAATSSANRAAKLLPSRLRPIVDRLEQVFDELYRGERNVREAMAMATVAAAIGRLIALGEYEERLRHLEENAQRIAGETGGQ
jgi:hypothetical protein